MHPFSSTMNLTSKTAQNEQIFRIEGLVPRAVFRRMPELRGRRIYVRYRPALTAWRGKLLSNSMKGDRVYAGAFLSKRRIVLEEQMLRTPRVLERIFIHEVFHFVWTRLGNPLRKKFELLVLAEIEGGTRGDLGWSAESLKNGLTAADRRLRTRKWKYYLCEAFCDTAGWFFGSTRRYAEMTLDKPGRATRRCWFREHVQKRCFSI